MAEQYREVSFVALLGSKEDPFVSDIILTFEDDGTAYRRIVSMVTDDIIDVPIAGTAIEYERRLMDAKKRMATADNLADATVRADGAKQKEVAV